MMSKAVIRLLTFALLLTLAISSQANLFPAETAAAQEGVDQTGPQLVKQAVAGLSDDAEAGMLPYTQDMKVLFEEMTFVWLQSEDYAYARTACAGNGLNNITSIADGPMVLIPNAGDLAVNGSNVAIKLNPDGEITFIPRYQGQIIKLPVDVGDKVAGEEVLSLSLAEAVELMAADRLVWTAKHHGPYGNGHGLPGHIAECDPLYPGPESE